LSASDIGLCPRTLVFPISVRVFRSDVFLGRSPSPPPPLPYSGDDREQDHDKRRRNPRSTPTAPVRKPVHARLGPSVCAGSVPGETVETVALPVPLGAETAASVSPPLARLGPCAHAGSAPGGAFVTVELPDPLGAEDAASGSPNSALTPSVSPPPALIPSVEAPQATTALITTHSTKVPGPASLNCVISFDLKDSGKPAVGDSLELALSYPPHDISSEMSVIEEIGGYPRIDQSLESHCADVSGRASVPIMQDPVDPVVNAAQVRDPWEIITYRLQAKPPCFKVYLRRRDDIPVHAQAVSSAASTPLQEFSQHISKAINGLLSPPPIPKRRKKTLLRNFRPRRSRRVAKFPPELGSEAAATICKKLGFYDDHGNISLGDASKYVVLYNSPLSREHIAGLATLFGWDTSELA
jgi:hypothetical protein